MASGAGPSPRDTPSSILHIRDTRDTGNTGTDMSRTVVRTGTAPLAALAVTAALIGAAITSAPAAETPTKVAGPLRPADALGHFRVDDGLRIDLVLSEPTIAQP